LLLGGTGGDLRLLARSSSLSLALQLRVAGIEPRWAILAPLQRR
jgi:hypothetical protein